MRGERAHVSGLENYEDEGSGSGSSFHGGCAATGAHHEAASRASHSNNSVSFDKPYKESRREREAAAHRESDGLELKIPYSMALVPECTITSTGIHVSPTCGPNRSISVKTDDEKVPHGEFRGGGRSAWESQGYCGDPGQPSTT